MRPIELLPDNTTITVRGFRQHYTGAVIERHEGRPKYVGMCLRQLTYLVRRHDETWGLLYRTQSAEYGYFQPFLDEESARMAMAMGYRVLHDEEDE